MGILVYTADEVGMMDDETEMRRDLLLIEIRCFGQTFRR